MKTIRYKFEYTIIIATTISNKHENYIIIRSRKVITLSSLKYYIFISCNGYRIKDLRAVIAVVSSKRVVQQRVLL